MRFPELEATLGLWVQGCEALGQIVTGPLIIEKVKRIALHLAISEDSMSFSPGWLASFKERHMLSDHRRHGEAGSASPESAQEERLCIRGLLEGKDPEFIFNCDETVFLWRHDKTHGLSTKHIAGKKMDKSRVSVLVTMNATGTRKIHLLFIGSAAKP